MNMEDKNIVLDGGPYFFYSVGLFIRPWKENFFLNKEEMRVSSIWICLYSLPSNYWDSKILEDIGNNMVTFIKISKKNKEKIYTSYARICVYMDLSKQLP